MLFYLDPTKGYRKWANELFWNKKEEFKAFQDFSVCGKHIDSLRTLEI